MTRAGYAFPMALAAVIVIALVTAVAAQQVRSSSRGVIALSDAAARERDAFSAEQTLIYSLLTEPMEADGVLYGGEPGDAALAALGVTRQSLPEGAFLLRADGEPWRPPEGVLTGPEALFIRLYDSESFFNVAGAAEDELERMLTLLGAERARISRLAAAHLDYRDEDRRRTLGGGEAPSYDDPSLPPNRRLRDPLEVCRIVGWAEAGICEDRSRLLLLTTIRLTTAMNARVASRVLLEFALNDPDEADDAMERIRNREATRFAELGLPELDLVADALQAASAAGPDLVLVTHPESGVPARRTAIRLTPQDLTSPYEVMNTYVLGGEAAARFLRVPENAELIGLPDAGEDAGARERR